MENKKFYSNYLYFNDILKAKREDKDGKIGYVYIRKWLNQTDLSNLRIVFDNLMPQKHINLYYLNRLEQLYDMEQGE